MESSYKETSTYEQSISNQENTFTIKRLIPSPHITQVSVSFPIVSRISQLHEPIETEDKSDENAYMSTYPSFNFDRNFFTPCFVLDADRSKVQKNLSFYLDFHEKRVIQSSQDKEQILVPKPSKNHSNCSLCKMHYSDYLEHINTITHMDKIRKSKLYKNVQVLSKLLERRQKRTQKNKKMQLKKLEKLNKPIQKQRKKRITKPKIQVKCNESVTSTNDLDKYQDYLNKIITL